MNTPDQKLLIFDCDGVLVDSEPLANRIFIQCLQKEGFDIDEAYGLANFYGIALKDCLVHVEDRFGRSVSDTFVETLSLLTNEEIKRSLEPIPNVAQALAQLPHRKCVASGSDYDKIQLSLEVTGLSIFFEWVFSVVDVPRGKPAPDIFLHAARQMLAEPANCIVIEDSRAGMQAGIAAGMQVLLYSPPDAIKFDVPAGVTVFADMLDLPLLVNSTP